MVETFGDGQERRPGVKFKGDKVMWGPPGGEEIHVSCELRY